MPKRKKELHTPAVERIKRSMHTALRTEEAPVIEEAIAVSVKRRGGVLEAPTPKGRILPPPAVQHEEPHEVEMEHPAPPPAPPRAPVLSSPRTHIVPRPAQAPMLTGAPVVPTHYHIAVCKRRHVPWHMPDVFTQYRAAIDALSQAAHAARELGVRLRGNLQEERYEVLMGTDYEALELQRCENPVCVEEGKV